MLIISVAGDRHLGLMTVLRYVYTQDMRGSVQRSRNGGDYGKENEWREIRKEKDVQENF